MRASPSSGCLSPTRSPPLLNSWDTVQQGPSLDSYRDPLAPLGYYGDRRWRDGAAPTLAARAATASASAAAAGGRLLAVDMMKLADGQGYAGELAAVVESTGCCTYRIVVGDGGHHRGAGEGGVGVHVSSLCFCWGA